MVVIAALISDNDLDQFPCKIIFPVEKEGH